MNRKKERKKSSTDTLIRFHALRTLGAGAARIREIMKPVRGIGIK